jgi:hypothetical protein
MMVCLQPHQVCSKAPPKVEKQWNVDDVIVTGT